MKYFLLILIIGNVQAHDCKSDGLKKKRQCVKVYRDCLKPLIIDNTLKDEWFSYKKTCDIEYNKCKEQIVENTWGEE